MSFFVTEPKGLAAGSGTIMGFVSCDAATSAATGSAVPIVGTLISAGVDLLVGGLVGDTIIAKQKQKKRASISRSNQQTERANKGTDQRSTEFAGKSLEGERKNCPPEISGRRSVGIC